MEWQKYPCLARRFGAPEEEFVVAWLHTPAAIGSNQAQLTRSDGGLDGLHLPLAEMHFFEANKIYKRCSRSRFRDQIDLNYFVAIILARVSYLCRNRERPACFQRRG